MSRENGTRIKRLSSINNVDLQERQSNQKTKVCEKRKHILVYSFYMITDHDAIARISI